MTCPLDNHYPGCCQWCEKKLRGRQKRWCSRTCSRKAVAEHRWTQAKAVQLKEAAWFECAHCEYLFRKQDIQVNHIVPCKGQHGKWGCHHHSDNLEVLCKPCHLVATAKQREQGLI